MASAGRESEPPSPSVGPPPSKPKMSVADARQLRGKFMKAYPGELLTPQTMPSLAFLQMVKDQVEDGSLGWIPWKARTSDAVELQFLENRRPRNDKQLLHSILRSEEGLLDESAEAQIPKHEPVELVLTRLQTLLTNCLALLEVAHLLVLKRFAHKFLEVATAVPRDPGLRAPSLQEILDADRTIWLTIADIVRDNRWSYNDTLNEVAFCRQDIHSALQPWLVSNVPVNHRKRSAPEVPPPPPPHPEPRPKKTPPKKEGRRSAR